MRLFLITYTGNPKEFKRCFRCEPRIKIKAKNEEEALKSFFKRTVPLMSEETKKGWVENINVEKKNKLNPKIWFIAEVKPFKFKKIRRLTFKQQVYLNKATFIIYFIVVSSSILFALYCLFKLKSPMISSLSSGYLVSWIFYIVVVYIPEKRRRNLIKKNLKESFYIFKEEVINQFLFALYGCLDASTIKDHNLLDIHSFNKFFDYKVKKNCPKSEDERLSDGEWLSDHSSRWYALLNKIKPEHFKEIKKEIEIFNKTLISSAQSVNVTNSFIFSVIINLSRELYRLKHLEPENNHYDDEKSFMRSISEMFSGWDFIEGQKSYDPIIFLIKEM